MAVVSVGVAILAGAPAIPSLSTAQGMQHCRSDRTSSTDIDVQLRDRPRNPDGPARVRARDRVHLKPIHRRRDFGRGHGAGQRLQGDLILTILIFRAGGKDFRQPQEQGTRRTANATAIAGHCPVTRYRDRRLFVGVGLPSLGNGQSAACGNCQSAARRSSPRTCGRGARRAQTECSRQPNHCGPRPPDVHMSTSNSASLASSRPGSDDPTSKEDDAQSGQKVHRCLSFSQRAEKPAACRRLVVRPGRLAGGNSSNPPTAVQRAPFAAVIAASGPIFRKAVQLAGAANPGAVSGRGGSRPLCPSAAGRRSVAPGPQGREPRRPDAQTPRRPDAHGRWSWDFVVRPGGLEPPNLRIKNPLLYR
jgi:hypothetical protein